MHYFRQNEKKKKHNRRETEKRTEVQSEKIKKKNYCGDRRSATQSGAGAVLGR